MLQRAIDLVHAVTSLLIADGRCRCTARTCHAANQSSASQTLSCAHTVHPSASHLITEAHLQLRVLCVEVQRDQNFPRALSAHIWLSCLGASAQVPFLQYGSSSARIDHGRPPRHLHAGGFIRLPRQRRRGRAQAWKPEGRSFGSGLRAFFVCAVFARLTGQRPPGKGVR
jgi:hypothetical protein